MIQSIYETHVQVKQLEKSIEFYKGLGIVLAYKIEERRCAFFYVGEKKQMLGIWEVAEGEKIKTNHFAFGVTLEDLKRANEWLQERGIRLRKSFEKEPIEPIVHDWMPSAAVYFYDLDGNSLEFNARLDEESIGISEVLYLSEWLERKIKKADEI
ncbi:VOC family protein [Bacillus cereus]|uniref:VOC family protein n=1 Tax=Bacillus cereus TaxID=1396 RepID=UPI002A550D39|nr:VOC family protein [Bacillus pseudomycoides]